jgi:hypothetical protein
MNVCIPTQELSRRETAVASDQSVTNRDHINLDVPGDVAVTVEEACECGLDAEAFADSLSDPERFRRNFL